MDDKNSTLCERRATQMVQQKKPKAKTQLGQI